MVLLEYEDKDTFTNRKLGPFSKIFLVLWTLFIVSFVSDPFATGFILALFLFLGIASKLPWRRLWNRGFQVLIIGQLTTAIIFMFFLSGQAALATFHIYRGIAMTPISPLFQIGPWQLQFTLGSLIFGWGFFCRGTSLFLSVVLLLYTTLPSLLMSALYKLKFPNKLGSALLIMYRFIPSLSATLQDILGAQHSRGMGYATRNSRNPLNRAKALIPVAYPLIQESMAIADRLGLAMETRCFGHGKWTSLNDPKLTKYDTLFILALSSIAIALIVSLLFFGIGGL
jgi:energy-coupling factor transporter transmembrane protein EcfT